MENINNGSNSNFVCTILILHQSVVPLIAVLRACFTGQLQVPAQSSGRKDEDNDDADGSGDDPALLPGALALAAAAVATFQIFL